MTMIIKNNIDIPLDTLILYFVQKLSFYISKFQPLEIQEEGKQTRHPGILKLSFTCSD